jgi:hypothetical protein
VKSALRKRAKRGFRGHPLATVVFYGPTGAFASKVAVGIVGAEGAEPQMHTFSSTGTDVRGDVEIHEQILALLQANGVKTVLMTDGLLGCPHEEGIDYPVGESCPQCPYWAGRDRFSGQRVQ